MASRRPRARRAGACCSCGVRVSMTTVAKWPLPIPWARSRATRSSGPAVPGAVLRSQALTCIQQRRARRTMQLGRPSQKANSNARERHAWWGTQLEPQGERALPRSRACERLRRRLA